MKRFILSVLLACLLLAPATAQSHGCDSQSATRGEQVQDYVPGAMACLEQPPAGYSYRSSIEQEMFHLANAERAAHGLPALLWRQGLLAPARVHSFDMAREGFFAHHGPDNRSPFDRISALDRTLVQSETRENLASATGGLVDAQIAALLHDLLMNSPAHRENILAPNVTHMAVGLARTRGGAWATQLFVKQDGTLTAPLKTAHKVGDPLALDADLSDRELAGAVFQGPRGREYTSFAGRDAPSGDLQLLVIGERWLDARTRSSVKLNGPAISIVY